MEDLVSTWFNILSFVKGQCGNNREYEVNQLITNFNLYSNGNTGIRCEMCKGGHVAMKYCKDCYCYIDDQCYDFHNNMKHLIGHEMVDFTQGHLEFLDFVPHNCCHKKGHGEFQLDTYCVNCKKLLCKRCVKHHIKRNHYLNSLTDLHKLMNEIFKSRSELQAKLVDIPGQQNCQEKEVIASTFLQWIERAVDVGFRDINHVDDPPLVNEFLEKEMEERGGSTLSTAKYTREYVSCVAVLEKFLHVKADLYNYIGVRESELVEGEFHNVPYRVTEDLMRDQMDDQDYESSSMSSISSSDSSGSFQDINSEISVNRTIENIVVAEHEQSPPRRGKTIEVEILNLQANLQACKEDFNFDSFQDIHPQ